MSDCFGLTGMTRMGKWSMKPVPAGTRNLDSFRGKGSELL